MTLSPGAVLGAYRIVRPLGEGGMGCVYEAEHVELRVRRALKVFVTSSEHSDFLRKRFVAEGRILADLQHPRIVRVYDFAVDEATGAPYFAMDLVVSPTGKPQTLEDVCQEGLDEERVAGWFCDISEGLGYIHSKGVVHRDISLDNILLDKDGRAVLTDFGIAKIVGEDYRRKIDVTVTMAAMAGEKFRLGKGLYMAPELKSGGEATPASDVYAVGIVLFRLLAGSWYTPDARLEDALAGFDSYDWVSCLRSLLAVDPLLRVKPSEAESLLVSVGRRSHWMNGRLVLLAIATFAATVAVFALLLRQKNVKASAVEPVTPSQELMRDEQALDNHSNTELESSSVYHIVDVPYIVTKTQTVYKIEIVTNRVETATNREIGPVLHQK